MGWDEEGWGNTLGSIVEIRNRYNTFLLQHAYFSDASRPSARWVISLGYLNVEYPNTCILFLQALHMSNKSRDSPLLGETYDRHLLNISLRMNTLRHSFAQTPNAPAKWSTLMTYIGVRIVGQMSTSVQYVAEIFTILPGFTFLSAGIHRSVLLTKINHSIHSLHLTMKVHAYGTWTFYFWPSIILVLLLSSYVKYATME